MDFHLLYALLLYFTSKDSMPPILDEDVFPANSTLLMELSLQQR